MRKINRLSPMKKIIVPVEGTAYRPELLEFARLLGTRSRVLLTAALFPNWIMPISGQAKQRGWISQACHMVMRRTN